jgi:alkylhydroperoxidase/carboxymuconolactone decarboxylase family protein YurZ
MAETSRSEQAEALIAKMKAARGYMYPEWEFAARQDPEFVEAYNRLHELSLGDGRHVSAKVRKFVAIALLCFRGAEQSGLVVHMRRAIKFGATPAELFEVLESCVVPGGAPTFHRGLTALMEVVSAPNRPPPG